MYNNAYEKDKYGEVLTVKEVMNYLKMGKNSVYGLLQSGELPSFKIGKVYRVPLSSVQEYLEQAVC